MIAELEIINDLGLHTRAATKLVKLARTFVSVVQLSRNGLTANAKSILGLLALGARKGKMVKLFVHGPDQKEAFQAVCGLIRSGFDEGAV